MRWENLSQIIITQAYYILGEILILFFSFFLLPLLSWFKILLTISLPRRRQTEKGHKNVNKDTSKDKKKKISKEKQEWRFECTQEIFLRLFFLFMFCFGFSLWPRNCGFKISTSLCDEVVTNSWQRGLLFTTSGSCHTRDSDLDRFGLGLLFCRFKYYLPSFLPAFPFELGET